MDDARHGDPPAAAPPRGRRRLLVTLGVLVACAAVAELVTRVLADPPGPLRLAQMDKVLKGSKRHRFVDLFREDDEVFWRFKPNLTAPPGAGVLFGRISNGQGLRENESVSVAKPPGEVRVLFLGDSCTFGYLLPEHHTFVALTEKRLRAKFSGRAIRCINAGVPGYTAFQCWRYLETEGFGFSPDLVVFQFGWNGRIVWDGRSDPEHYRALRAVRPPSVLASSRVCQLLWAKLFWPGPGDDGRARLAPAEFRRVLERLAVACKARGVEFLLLLTGCRENIRSQALTPLQGEQMQFAGTRRFGASGAPPLVDGVSILHHMVLKQRRSIELFLFDEAHPKLLYNDALSDALCRKIEPWLAAR